MRKMIGAVCALVGGCGGGDFSAVDACKDVVSKECSLFFSCLSEAEKQAAQGSIGLNSSDCRTKLEVNCTQERVACGSGETYHEDKAQACVNDFKTFTCADVSGTAITMPASCGQICTTG